MSNVGMDEPQPFSLNETKFVEQLPTGTFWSRQAACALLLVLTDVAAIAISLRTAIFLRIHLLPQLDRHIPHRDFSFWHYTVAFGWMWLVLVAFLGVEGLYTQRRSLWNEIGHLTKAIGLSVAAILGAVGLTQPGPVVSRPTILLTTIMLLILLPGARYWAKWTLGELGLWRKRILILGAAETARLAMQGLTSDPVLGYEVAGLLDDDPLKINQCIGSCGGKLALVLGSLSEAGEQMMSTTPPSLHPPYWQATT